MRKFVISMIATLAATISYAGSAVMTAPDVMIVEPPMSNGSGAWLIPLAIIAILALTLSGDAAQPSDIRLKTGITPAGIAPDGLPLYTFRYIGGNHTYLGVMAQDVLMHTPEAVVAGPFGYMAVDYGALGMEMQRID